MGTQKILMFKYFFRILEDESEYIPQRGGNANREGRVKQVSYIFRIHTANLQGIQQTTVISRVYERGNSDLNSLRELDVGMGELSAGKVNDWNSKI